MKLCQLPFAGFIASVLQLSGCTGMQPVELSPAEVQQHIRSGELLRTDDFAKLVMSNGDILTFRIVTIDIDKDAVTGDEDSVQIGEIVAVETREFHPTRTAGMVLLGWLIIDLADATASVADY